MYIETKKTPYFKPNECSCKAIIFHITADKNYNQAVNWLCSSENTSRSSAHLVIEKNGDMFKLVNNWSDKTNHAGVIKNPTAEIYFDNGLKNPNTYAIGVEVVAVPGEKLTDAQKQSIVYFLKDMSKAFGIKINNYYINGHYQFDSVSRAQDPISVYTIQEIIDLFNESEEEQIDMEQLKILENQLTNLTLIVQNLTEKISILESKNKIYHFWSEIPDWAYSSIKKAYNKGIFKGNSPSDLNLTEDLMRTLVIMDQNKMFENQKGE